MMKSLLCLILGHKLVIKKHIRGNIKHGTRLLFCSRCKHKFIMNDEYEAFLCYDNDSRFMADLLRIYAADGLTAKDL